jgi:hypothetical protein
MHNVLLVITKWLEATPWGVMTRTSTWAYPFVQLTHFTGLSIWLGTSFALDLRLLSRQPAFDGSASPVIRIHRPLRKYVHSPNCEAFTSNSQA